MSVITPPSWENLEVPPFPVHRFSVSEYHRLGEMGVLTEVDRVELLEGWIVPKVIHNPPHDAAVELVEESLRSRVPAGWRIRVQSAITTADSEPEPDLAVVSGPIRDHAKRHPQPREVALLVEVADTSVARDRAKGRVYARANIPLYWILNLVDSQLEVYSDPSVSDGTYQHRQDYDVDQSIGLVIAGQELGQILVRDLMP